MEQLSIYHIIGMSADPLFEKLAFLSQNNSITIEGLIVNRKKDGSYEVLNEGMSICSKSTKDCYNEVTRILCPLKNDFF